MLKMYLSLDEAERLIFNKILIVPEQRLEIKRAQGPFSVAVTIEDEIPTVENELILIFISGVKKFEISEEDKNVFLNHCNLPLGLLTFKKRKARDVAGDESSFEQISPKVDIDAYTAIRRAFISIYHQAVRLGINTEESKCFLQHLNSFDDISSFQRQLIVVVLENKCLPSDVMSVRNQNFSSQVFYQWIWWAKFIVNNLLTDVLDEDEIKDHKDWLKLFNPDDLQDIEVAIANVPEKFESQLSMIVGYHQAITTSPLSLSNNEIKSTPYRLESLSVEKKSEVVFWRLFFQSLFLDKTDYIYPTSIIQSDFYDLEVNAYEVAKNISRDSNLTDLKSITVANDTEDSFIKSYCALKNGIEKNEVEIVDIDAAFEKLGDSPLFGENKDQVGFIFNTSREVVSWSNYIELLNNSFKMYQEHSARSVVYYGDAATDIPIKLKRKSLSSIISRKKKVLFGVISHGGINEIFNIYAHIINNGRLENIEELLFIWEVDRAATQLHTAFFDEEKRSLKNELEQLFKQDVMLFAKNKNNQNDSEIKRLIRQVIGEYRLSEIEVIDNDFSQEQAQWLVESTCDCILRKQGFDYSVLHSQ